MDKNVSKQYLTEVFSFLDETLIDEVIATLFGKNFKNFASLINTLKQKNLKSDAFFEQIILALRDKMIAHLSDPNFQEYSDIFNIFREAYHSLKYFNDGFLFVEITLMQALNRKNLKNLSDTSSQENKHT